MRQLVTLHALSSAQDPSPWNEVAYIFRVSLPKKHLHRYTQSCLSKSNQLDNDNLTVTHTGKILQEKKSQTTRYISIRSKRSLHLPRGLLSHHFPWFDLKETWLFRGVCSPLLPLSPMWGRRKILMRNPGGPVAFSSDWLQVITNKM